MTPIDFSGHPLTLLPTGAVHACAPSALFIADPHFAKSAVFRHAGLGVPDGSDAAVLDRIRDSLALAPARSLVILGDVFHARTPNLDATLNLIATWRENHPDLHWTIVPGNHDRRVPWASWLPGAEILPEGTRFGPWCLAHHPPSEPSSPTLCGHLHPGIAFGPPRQRKIKSPCFWLRHHTLVLPAFGEFTGLHLIHRQPGDRVWIPAGPSVLEVPGGNRDNDGP
jgi:DNA ligase-associated metallophosphoesterase